MRRLLLFLGFGLIAGVVVLLSLPWWLGTVLRTAAGRAGAEFETYERRGYNSFAIRGVRVVRPGMDLWIEAIEAPTPVVWAWRHLLGMENTLIAGAWELEFREGPAGAPRPARDGEAVAGWASLQERLSGVVDTLDHWLPSASAGRGRVHGAGLTVTVEAVAWDERTLRLSRVGARGFDAEVALAWAEGNEAWSLNVTSLDTEAEITLRGERHRLIGEAVLWEQPARGEARFADEGWLPLEAEAIARDWRIPGEKLGLAENYATVTGGADARWRERRLEFSAAAQGEPVPGSEAPPLNVDVRAGGDFASFAVDALNIQMPGLRAELSAPVEIARDAGLAMSPSNFRFQSDLGALPWGNGAGSAWGEFQVVPVDGGWPRIEATAEAADVIQGRLNITRADFAAELTWPVLNVTQFSGDTADGGRWEGEGGWHFEDRQLLPSRLSGVLSRDALARWMRDEWNYETIEIEATAEGLWPDIRHAGTGRVQEAIVPPLKPVGLSFTWDGRGAHLDRFGASLTAGASSLHIEGSTREEAATVAALEWRHDGAVRWRLRAPVDVSWQDGVHVQGLQLDGETSSLALTMNLVDAEGRVLVQAEEFQSSWLEPWIALPGPAWHLQTLGVDGSWSDGPLRFGVSSTMTASLGEEREMSIDVSANGDADGIRIDRLLLAENGAAPILTASGRIPMTIMPAAPERWRVAGDGPLELSIASEPNPKFWAQLAELSGVRLVEPSLRAEVSGTWREPEGTLALTADRVEIATEASGRTLPEISELSARLTADGKGVELEEFSLLVAGQALRARGRLPLSPGGWREAWESPIRLLREDADLSIEIPDAELAAFARHVPAYLAPSGRLKLDLAIRPGGDWEGALALTGAATRPLGPLGVLQDIGADIRFAGRTVELRSVSARMGGQPVLLSGTVELPHDDGGPRLDLALKGENLPFVRQTGLLVRGDLDLSLQTLDEGRTRIGGSTRLRDSLFLSDVRSLIPQGGRSAAPARRPPYFSVEIDPLRDWELAVDVTGDRFLRLRTPVFTGVATARFRLGGTLGDPRAIGEATINEGQVLLPFANFTVRQGEVRLTEADPYDAQLLVTGTARRFGYDLRMELSGTASQPNLTFTSSPPLESEQVLLMVMAGEAPGDEVTYTGTQRAVRLGTYLGQSLINRLGGDPARADRFSLTTGERVSRQGRETYGFAYELDERWSLVGEYDEFDDYNIGVKRRIFARKKETASEPDEDTDAEP